MVIRFISRFFLLPVFAFSVIAPSALAVSSATFTQAPSGAIPGQYIVLLKDTPETTPESMLALIKSHQLSSATRMYNALKGFSIPLSSAQLEAMRKDPQVQYISPDYKVQAFDTTPVQARPRFRWPRMPRMPNLPPNFPRFPNYPGWPGYPGYPPTDPGTPPTDPGTPPTDPGTPPADPGTPPTNPPTKPPTNPPTNPPTTPPTNPPSTGQQKVEPGMVRIGVTKSPTAKVGQKQDLSNVSIAIIDTGTEKHADINVVQQVNYTSESSVTDGNGHGTHVAGIAAAKDNDSGVIGVAPGAKIWSIRVLDSQGSGQLSGVIAGINYVADHASEIDVANMSLGCENCQDSTMDAAIARAVNAGVVFVVASGNASKDAATTSPSNNTNVISVSAIADFDGAPGGKGSSTCTLRYADDSFAQFSNYGSSVAIAAPGTCINSTWIRGGYKAESGTSMASPHVAGAAALYIAGHSKPTNAAGVKAVRDALVSSAFEQKGTNGFTGGKSREPLLNVETF